MFYAFNQYLAPIDPRVVIIEAESAADANARAERDGAVYFDGVECGRDEEHNRWIRATSWCATDQPIIDGVPLTEKLRSYVGSVRIVFINGPVYNITIEE